MSSLWRDLAASFRNPEFWALSSWLDIMVRNRQSRLGVFWLLVPPMVYIWGIGGMFASMMGLSFREFVAYVALGYVVFRLISAVITESSGAFLSAASFILDGHLRLTDFILRVVAKALFYFLVSLPVVAASVYLSPDWHWQALPASLLALAWMTGITLCIGVVFAVVGARLPDVGQLVNNVFMFAFLLTPIIWHTDFMPAESLRGQLVRFNPLFHMVEVVRAPLLGMPVAPESYLYLCALTVVALLGATITYRLFARHVPVWV
ncbi:ABC transporter permease [Cognatiluteimonas lumbrici]|uniref:ABC transporter permease n=1 Tax=Cognatiluteimonas lumbrici TaxID=2559601 RepID=UPI00112EACAC|nr:ABC transporter permease [Luteimonas lumbrici]